MLNKSILSLLLITLSFMSFKGVAADFITPASVTSLHTNSSSAYNNVNALIENAVDISYIAPNPSGGGSRTSTWVSDSANTWTFNLDSAYTLNEIHVWDYYGHSPTGWELTFFDGDNASGTNLGSHTFSIAPVCVLHCSKLNTISFADVSNVKSVTLRSTNASARGGVGLAEVHFGGVITAPPPWHVPIGILMRSLGVRLMMKSSTLAVITSIANLVFRPIRLQESSARQPIYRLMALQTI